MARPEEIVPWAASRAAATEPYARKNLYFAGPEQAEVYDYCLWRANVRGYRTLEGSEARTTSEMIGDLLRRAYLKDMLDQDLADDFAAWRRREYEAAGLDAEDGMPRVSRFNAGAQQASDLQDSRFHAFMRCRSKAKRGIRIAVWRAQGGSCAVCRAPRRLRVYRHLAARKADHLIDSKLLEKLRQSAGQGAVPDLVVALCRSCHQHMHGDLIDLDSEKPNHDEHQAAISRQRNG